MKPKSGLIVMLSVVAMGYQLSETYLAFGQTQYEEYYLPEYESELQEFEMYLDELELAQQEAALMEEFAEVPAAETTPMYDEQTVEEEGPAVAEEVDPADFYEFEIEPELCNPLVSDEDLAQDWCESDANRIVNAFVPSDSHPLFIREARERARDTCPDGLDEAVAGRLAEVHASGFRNEEIDRLQAELDAIPLKGLSPFKPNPRLDLIEQIEALREAERVRMENEINNFVEFNYTDAIESLRAECPEEEPSPTESPVPTEPEPEATPSYEPSPVESPTPSVSPSATPSWTPSPEPSESPEASPSYEPTPVETAEQEPSYISTPEATPEYCPGLGYEVLNDECPEEEATPSPSIEPNEEPSEEPSVGPSESPEASPSYEPTPQESPQAEPSYEPSPEMTPEYCPALGYEVLHDECPEMEPTPSPTA